MSDIEQHVLAKRQETGSWVKGRVHFVVQHGADRAPALENVGRGALLHHDGSWGGW